MEVDGTGEEWAVDSVPEETRAMDFEDVAIDDTNVCILVLCSRTELVAGTVGST